MTTYPPLFESVMSVINEAIVVEIRIPHALFVEMDNITTSNNILNHFYYNMSNKRTQSYLTWTMPIPRAPIQQYLAQNENTCFDVKLIDETNPARWFIMSGKQTHYWKITRNFMSYLLPRAITVHNRVGKYGTRRYVDDIIHTRQPDVYTNKISIIRKVMLYYPHICNKSTKELKSELVFIEIQPFIITEE